MPIREMTEADLPQVLALQRELAFQDWNEKQFMAEIRANYALCVVYTEGPEAKLLGYAIFHLMGPDSELLSIATTPSKQRSGIGSALMAAGFAKLDFPSGDQMFLEVREGNAKARAFYEKHGFTQYNTRKNYYADGENAILYKR
ncbi:MAG: ribosomal protein S18-alanine N-acetyltransferase [Fibrobacter sp.]|nr:ribosomal protein S18-alanine N-acetyltransferase [Fibrobacter sp.]